jgi:hypothetical protein
MADPRSEPGAEGGPLPETPRCDFCGQQVPSVRRVALDADYDRLQKPHVERYACPECSERKERDRLGLSRS